MTYRLFFFSILLLLGLLVGQGVLAIGISPSVIEVQDLNVGSKVEKSVTLTRRKSNSTKTYQVRADGRGARAVVFPRQNFEFPSGLTEIPYHFFIQPKAEMSGDYEARIIFSVASMIKKIGMNTAVTTGVAVRIKFHVSNDQVRNFEIFNVYAPEIQEGRPVEFSFFLKNTGNIEVRPDRVEIILQDEKNISHTIHETIKGETLPFVQPSQIQEIKITATQMPKSGTYQGAFAFFLQDDVIYEKKNIKFRVEASRNEKKRVMPTYQPTWLERIFRLSL